MGNNLHLEIVTPFGKTFAEDILACVLPGVKGKFQILKNHAPVISNIGIGVIKVQKTDKAELLIATSGGFCEVRENVIKVIVESAEMSDSIDVNRAVKAKERAEERLKSKSDDIDEVRVKLALSRALNRINIAEHKN
jgi:F-type H+-transporting ATPase subunit epsilon